MKEGVIFNIQRYSVHDGPGIRTTIFFKGCPLACWWCHNPESQSYNIEKIYSSERCIGCGSCVKWCPQQVDEAHKANCVLCGACVEHCPTNALEMIGRKVSLEDLKKEIRKDLIFFEESGGGVTFSGGEPLTQLEFLSSLLEWCKSEDLHTAVDTSGYVLWEKLQLVMQKVDLFLYDLKIMDSAKHRFYTGVSNELILSNLKKLADENKKIYIRVPIIPGINDDRQNIKDIGEYIFNLGINQVNLLPYHNIGIDKYKKLGMKYNLSETQIPTKEQMLELADILLKMRLNVKIGG